MKDPVSVSAGFQRLPYETIISLLLAMAAFTAAQVVEPVSTDPDALLLFGHPFGQSCPFREATGLPCPSCGMTRSWVWAVRGEFWLALQFNAAGAVLFGGIVVNALIRMVGLAGVPLPQGMWKGGVAATLCWLLLWVGGWLLRMNGLYPLAGDEFPLFP